ncbi:MAG: cyclic nucleotide-binding protein [Alphaproteobacteria bacterium]|nr:MAG: cyclic nucleotide-binding protein [Alphaproteobacteria bacterium]
MHTPDKSQKTFNKGDIIMRQGEFGESAYIIEKGSVEISVKKLSGDSILVATRGVGAIIGEMSLIDNAPRTATVTAKEDCTLLEITKDDFTRRLDASDPVLRMTMQVILTRYRDTLIRADIRQEPAPLPAAESIELEYLGKTDAVDNIRISNEFMEALSKGEICLHYQPIINMQDGSVYGFEALMRWFHPERGFISPGIFIPIIEDSGLIVEASKWAFKESCNALKRIQGQTGYHNDLNMSVNFSSTDFSSDDFLDNIYNTISETDVQAKNIHLEITERLLMNQPAQAKETLDMCRKAGMGISIDDFGTGYSSLSYLHAFPINTLKIDQSFIRDMHENENSQALVKSIISLGKNLDMAIVAEGVEQIEEGKLLKEMGCDYAQGYYFAKPMSEEDVIKCVSNWDHDMI